ncbi:MAG: bacterial transcriptional activator domain-containing protein [Gemmatimonadota bacterium]
MSDALSHLRRVLGRDAIKARGDDVVLEADASVVIDAVALSDAASRNDHARVVALYQGPFLDGVYIDDAQEFDEWCDRVRARLAALFARSAAASCRSMAASGEWDECRALAERWLDAEPASGDAACLLLDAFEAPGTHAARVAALSAYQTLVVRLERDLGVSPSPEVARRAEAIRSALEAAPAPPPAPVAPPALTAVRPTRVSEQLVAAGPATSHDDGSQHNASVAAASRGGIAPDPPNALPRLTWAGLSVALLALGAFAVGRVRRLYTIQRGSSLTRSRIAPAIQHSPMWGVSPLSGSAGGSRRLISSKSSICRRRHRWATGWMRSNWGATSMPEPS